MEGTEKIDYFEKYKEIFSKYIIHILVVLIVIILIILLIPKKTMDEEIISKAQKYVKANNIALTNIEREFTFSQIGYELNSECYESGLVLASRKGYKVYYICNNIFSNDLKELLKSNQIHLNGSNPFYLRYGNIYQEPGYFSDEDVIVKTSGQVQGNIGMYLVKYEGIGNGISIKSNRLVVVTKKSFTSYPSLNLKGEHRISLLKGDNYIEPGYEAYDSKDGNITKNVIVNGNVDTSKTGRYILKYRVINSGGKEAETTRVVNVVQDKSTADFEITILPETITNGDVTINVKVTGTGYSFMLDPDGNIIKDTELNYKVSANDDYQFILKNEDGTIIEKEVTINNIDKVKPTGSCKSVVTNNKTVVTATANDESGISKYNYTVGTYKGESETNTYTVNSAVKTATSVTVYDKANNYEIINCIIEDKTTPVITPTQPTPPSTPTTPITVSGHYQTSQYGGLNYIIYYPDNLNLNNKNPLVIFLHGDGEKGTNVGSLSGLVFVKNMKSGKFQNAVYLVPQRPGASYWDGYISTVKSLIDRVISAYNIDTHRISITGHSSGGIGVYTMVSKYPNFFSGAVVVAGRNKDGNVGSLLTTPIRHYHGTNDTSVDYKKGEASATAIKNAGGNIEFIPLQGKYHGITGDVYNGTDAIEWMLRQYR